MRTPYKKSTVRDVALLAGVSQSAVSHYINGRVSVCSPETAQRINNAIAELHFTPARALRHQGRQATNTIGVCVSLPTEDEASSSYTYLHRFWSGVSTVVDERSYRIMHFPRSMRNAESCNPFLDGGIDGLLISSTTHDKRLEVLADAGLPTVCVTRSSNLPAGCGSVVVNERDVAYLAMSHLWELGHRRIGYFGAPIGSGRFLGPIAEDANDTAIKRHKYWWQWLADRRVDPTDLDIFVKGYDYIPLDICLEAAEHWLTMPNPPTAIFCASDRLAMSIMTALKSRGLEIPRDMSVVGIDNEGTSAVYDPPLTSIEVPVFETGRRAAQMLVDMVNGSTGSCLELPARQIMIRQSTCPPAGK
ncbi:MAG TPA: LacI family DNA-binding transcriptional regulator [Capsulimonadaceae bacterium]|jgi:DNA-binding LacI/PurR family transcriptional regulator